MAVVALLFEFLVLGFFFAFLIPFLSWPIEYVQRLVLKIKNIINKNKQKTDSLK